MEEKQLDQLVKILEEIREGQRLQLDRYEEVMALQREHLDLYKLQYERAERINAKAEEIQNKSAQIVGGVGKLLLIVIPFGLLLLLYLSWLIFL